ncbi:MAG: Zn-dependent protease with chaperone function transrane protein [Paucimonas sp.]|jgi:predicted Zn-dependent protease|nr:Zn-dependent protease with chaperone function transrane protein [Paucimonas sp.]
MNARAFYYDGQSSRRHEVMISISDGLLVMEGDVQRSCRLNEVDISERGQTAVRKLRFRDGAHAEVADSEIFTAMLKSGGHHDSAVVRMQQSWRATGAALLGTIAVLAAAYTWGLPAASKSIAHSLPPSVEKAIGGEALEFLDKHIMAPSELDAARRHTISTRFASLAAPRGGAPDYELLFRKSKIGPNAFALPSGQIVLTDELVKLAENDDAVMGVLAHELGHLHERHLLRRLIQSSAIGIAAMAILGDVSSVIANIPTLMLDLKYSRDIETEADDYAVAMMKANRIDPSGMVALFRQLEKEAGKPASSYLASHPATEERILRLRSAGVPKN